MCVVEMPNCMVLLVGLMFEALSKHETYSCVIKVVVATAHIKTALLRTVVFLFRLFVLLKYLHPHRWIAGMQLVVALLIYLTLALIGL